MDLVIHAAAIVDWGTKKPKEVYEANYTGTQHVINASKQNEVPILVYTSSLDTVITGKPLLNVDKSIFIICNGYKRPQYIENIIGLLNDGFENVIPVLDSMNEFSHYDKRIKGRKKVKVGIRIAAGEEPNFEFYTSRLGIRYDEIREFYIKNITHHNMHKDNIKTHYIKIKMKIKIKINKPINSL